MTDDDSAAREILADVEHTRWGNWQRWMHSLGIRNPDGSMTIPAEHVVRWDRQIETAYADLSEPEKNSDRKEADTSIAALTDAGYEITRRDPAAGRVSEPRTHDPDDVPYCRHGFPEGVGCDACRRELTEATTG